MASLVAAHEALSAGAWSLADSTFRAVTEETGDSLAHEGLARIARWADDGETCLAAPRHRHPHQAGPADPSGGRRRHDRRDPVMGLGSASGLMTSDSQRGLDPRGREEGDRL
jgi:hypothetical protein